MPRKKSATKKAREAEERSKNQPEEKKLQDKEPDLEESENESSSSEEEDEYGELITEDVEEGMDRVLTALRNGNTKELLNPDVKFFEHPEETAERSDSNKKHKPIYLKDYHRMNILSGNALKDEESEQTNGNGTVDGKQSYVESQNEERSQILKEINEEFKKGNEKEEEGEDNEDDADDDDDDLLVKKEQQAPIPELKLPDPEVNGENFLREFDSKHAWIPREGDHLNSNMEEDDEEFDNAAENFENAYNFRFEDPSSANIVSYARNQATLRRSDSSARRRKRDETKQQKQLEKNEKEKTLHKKKTEKVRKLSDLLEQLQLEYGKELDQALVEKITNRLMNSDFQVSEWDQAIGELFDSEFYADEGKPKWDEDDEIMADFYKETENEMAGEEEVEPDSDGPPEKKAKKDKNEKKKAKRHLHETVENAVENNKLALIDEVEEERKSRARTKEEQNMRFRYRGVSPESFGLTARDIFAADDSELNKYIGLKKFAPYRAKELRMKDKRKAAKPRRLKEWRKEVFNNEEGPLLDPPVQEQKSSSRRNHHNSKKHKRK